MLCKFLLKIGSVHFDETDSLDITSELANIDEVRMTYVRSGLDSMIRKCTSEIKVFGAAREALINEYKTNYLSAKASMAVYQIENDWTYTKVWQCPLDFTTFKYDKSYLTINCLDNSAVSLLKAQKSVKFEFPVADVKDVYPLSYDGVKMKKTCEFMLDGSPVEGQTYMTINIQAKYWFCPQLSYMDNDINSSDVTIRDQEQTFSDGTGDVGANNDITSAYFLECINPTIVHIDFSTLAFKNMPTSLWWGLYRIRGTQVTLLTTTWYEFGWLNSKLSDMKGDFSLIAGDKLQLAAYHQAHTAVEAQVLNNKGTATWNEQMSAIDIDVIKPSKLLSKILDAISTDDQGIYASIDDSANERLRNTYIVAGESIRGMKDAKITTSYNDFCKFMESVFGYVPKVTYAGIGPSIEKDKILNCVDFEGFTSKTWNIYNTDTVFKILFSIKGGKFVNVQTTSSGKEYIYYMFPGYEQYAVYNTTAKCYDVRTDVVFRDLSNYKCYYAELSYPYDNPGAASGTQDNSFATLKEFKLTTINGVDYTRTSAFGGIIDTATVAEGSYTGTTSIENIYYVRKLRKFVYKDGDNYYGTYMGVNDYNSNDEARTDVIFIQSESKYVVIGYSLVEYTGDIPELGVDDKYMDEEKLALVTFVHRSKVFDSTNKKVIDVYHEPEYTINEGRIYSQVKVGYEKQDYDDDNNGFDEFNFTNTYCTGVSLNSNTLDLSCPYRADCYGFEELAEKRGKDSESTNSDSSVFIVKLSATKTDDSRYVIDRSLTISNAYSDTLFNATFAPMFMIQANEGYIGMITSKLTFASSEGNSNIAIGDNKMSDDITISDRLFTCGDITISTNDLDMPSCMEGLVEFVWDGVTYQGYISSTEAKFRQSDEVKYELIEK